MTLLCLPLVGTTVACSEQEDEKADDYANWQQRNEAFIETAATKYKRLKTYTKDANAEGKVSDYVYYEVIEEGEGGDSPYYTDSVRISYRGRLIPTVSYPEGYIFDETYKGDFSWQTTATNVSTITTLTEGFATAMMHMHRGDRWRLYIPYQLGYNTTAKEGIPAYSTLVFDVALADFSHPGHKLSSWSARRR